jgi:hypothetical protein
MEDENTQKTLIDDLDIEEEFSDKNDEDIENKEEDEESDDKIPQTHYLDDDDEDEVEEVAKQEEKPSESVVISKSKAILIKKLLRNIKENNDQVIELLSGLVHDEDIERIAISQISEKEARDEEQVEDGKIIEGVFDGENMIGPDGKQYTVPANYASKSKLVEGDIMKLTITHSGTFVYKQIGPIERIRMVGILEKDEEGRFFVKSDSGKWRILPASVTYFKGDIGDEAVVLIPKNGESRWGAVENVIRNVGN